MLVAALAFGMQKLPCYAAPPWMQLLVLAGLELDMQKLGMQALALGMRSPPSSAVALVLALVLAHALACMHQAQAIHAFKLQAN